MVPSSLLLSKTSSLTSPFSRQVAAGSCPNFVLAFRVQGLGFEVWGLGFKGPPAEEHKLQDIHVPKHEPSVLRIFNEACPGKRPYRAPRLNASGFNVGLAGEAGILLFTHSSDVRHWPAV